MTSRKRKSSSTYISDASRSVRTIRSSTKKSTRKKRRRNILETLEPRQLLAGPQLIGVQPNDGDLIVDGSIVNTPPRVLTLRFDEDQRIDPTTLDDDNPNTVFDGIRLTRSGGDDRFGPAPGTGNINDVIVTPALVTVDDTNRNEVIVRFNEKLPDDLYRLEVFGFDDDGLGIVGLRNEDRDLLQPSEPGQRSEVLEFDLRLGALIESVVPQPVVRAADGSLTQNRNEIVVYFNEDPLFVEDDSAQGVIAIGGDEITVDGALDGRSWDNVEIVFNETPNATGATAVFDPQSREISVEYPSGTTFDAIAAAINALPNFSALVTAGSGVAVFPDDPHQPIVPDDPRVRFSVDGNPTERSAEHPRFYQLLLTQNTVRTTDDALYFPDEVVYDPATHTARLFFSDDLNNLGPDSNGNTGVPLGGGTFRLRIGTAVDQRVDVILEPTELPVTASAVTDFGLTFVANAVGEAASGRQIRFEDSGIGGLSARVESTGTVVFDFGGDNPTLDQLRTIATLTPSVAAVVETRLQAGVAAATPAPTRIVGAPPLVLTAVGDTLETAINVGVFGLGDQITNLVFTEAIDPQPFAIELAGGQDDPGHEDDLHINPAFGADSLNGITEVPYNFNGIFDSDTSGNNFLNQITERQKKRIREALNLWASEIGVQFRETVDQGITFAVADPTDLQFPRQIVSQLNASLRIDSSTDASGRLTFDDAAIVFDNNFPFRTDYGEDFTRKSVAGIGLLLGLGSDSNLPAPSIMSLNSAFLNADINFLSDFEPVFPNNLDVLHGNYVHRSDSTDIDLYRFEVDLADVDRVGTLTAETLAERLPDASLLDTTLTLFQEQSASVTTNFGIGTELAVTITSLVPGRRGNNARIDFIKTDRAAGDSAVKVRRSLDQSDNVTQNGIVVDLPRNAAATVQDVVDAINDDPFASSIFDAATTAGDDTIDISNVDLSFAPLLLRGGGVVQLSRNDDYFGEDSRIVATLGQGVYYVGVAASGNDQYDPTIPGSGFGGRTQGAYDLQLKFEPEVDEVNIIRDLDLQRTRIDVPGTPIDGDGDGRPGGVHNFWFQTRALERIINFTGDGSAIIPGQSITLTGGDGVTRTYEFVEDANNVRIGNVPVLFSDGVFPHPPGGSVLPMPGEQIAENLRDAIKARLGETGVQVEIHPDVPTALQFTLPNDTDPRVLGLRNVQLSSNPPFFAVEVLGRTMFVDKSSGPQADGSTNSPFNNIANPIVPNAFGAAREDDIVRIVGNGGADGNITTEIDNLSYQIGVSESGGLVLEDGRNMEVPKGVTTMIDAGAAFKLRNSFIGIGSSTIPVDRSGGALQVLGAPRHLQLSAENERVSTTPIILASGVAQGSTASSIQLAASTTLQDDAINGALIRIISGTGAGQSRLVTNYVGFTDRATITPNWVTAPDSTSVYEVVESSAVDPDSFDDGSVIFTSTRDRRVDLAAVRFNPPAAAPGDWGGLIYRRDLDQAQGRRNLEDEGIFLQRVNHAEIVYGGGTNIVIDSKQQLVNPIQIVNMRPTVTFNEITRSADAAISAAPDSFEETSYQEPRFQQAGAFTADYGRVGPEIHDNLLLENSINGLFIRITTTPTEEPKQLTVSGRFDDTDVVHYFAENLVLASSPGGTIEDGVAPSLGLVSGRGFSGGTLAADTYFYKLTFVDRDGFESLESPDTFQINITSNNSAIELASLPQVQSNSGYVSRRLYRSTSPVSNFGLVADLDASSTRFIDRGQSNIPTLNAVISGGSGTALGGSASTIQLGAGSQFRDDELNGRVVQITLGTGAGQSRSIVDFVSSTGIATVDTNWATVPDNTSVYEVISARRGVRGRRDASLVMDPGLVNKLRGARIELGQGTQLLAEGVLRNPVVFTSALDDRFGAGGTFDTNNDNDTVSGPASPQRGDWSGIYAGPTSHVSFDQVQLSYAGGISLLEGGLARGFLPLELQQAEGRITNSRFEFNDSGQDGQGPGGRFGRLAVSDDQPFDEFVPRDIEATIIARGTQPIIVGNTFVDNRGSIIDIDVESMGGNYRRDAGRQTGSVDRLAVLDDNHGPMIRFNRYLNDPTSGVQLSGLEVRGGTITTETIFDDTDIAHLIFDGIIVENFHSSGGLRMLSRPDESLVVKFIGPGSPNSPYVNTGPANLSPSGFVDPQLTEKEQPGQGTGIVATGSPSGIEDRIGGAVHIIGLPGAPVILTSINDDTAGAGSKPDGSQFTDHDGTGTANRPFANDWAGLYFDQFSNDYNIPVLPELELSTEAAPGRNALVDNAQFLGELASNLLTSDHVRRLGFEVEGFLSGTNDVDVYSFVGLPGTEIWVDVDKTNFTTDTVIELLNENGDVLARSDNSFDETAEVIATGTAQGGATSTVQLAAASSFADDELNGRKVRIIAGRGAGQIRLVTDYDGATDTATVSPNWTFAPNSTSIYEIVEDAVTVFDNDLQGVTSSLQTGDEAYTDRGVFDLYEDFGSTNPRDAGIHYRLAGSSSSLYFFRIRSASINPDDVRGGLTGGGYRFQARLTEEQAFPGSVVRFADIRYANNGVHVQGLMSSSPLLGEAQENEPAALENFLVSGLADNGTIFGSTPGEGAQYIGDLQEGLRQVISVGGELSSSFDVDLYHFEISEGLQSTVFDIDYADGFNRPDTNISVFYDSDGIPAFSAAQNFPPQLVFFGSSSNIADDLTSPNGENSAIEKLIRGSISNGDPFVGPVTLPAGSYYIGITADGSEPISLDQSVREPVNSVDRIVEDRIDLFGQARSTANPPDLGNGQLFPNLTGGFSVLSDASPGHGKPQHFDGTSGFVAPPTPPPPGVSELAATGIFDASDEVTATVPPFTPNLDDLTWSLADNFNIGGQGGINTSTTIPHITLSGSLVGDPADFFQLSLTDPFTRVILDIDNGWDATGEIDEDDDPATPPTNLFGTSVDTTLVILQATPGGPNPVQLVQTSDSSFSTADGRAGSNSLLDPFIDTTLGAGTYFIGVLHDVTALTINNTGAVTDGEIGPGGSYTLQVSVANHVVPPGVGSSSSVLAFNRGANATSGTITSQPFSLAGYTAADVPLLYLNRLYQPAPGDFANLSLTSIDPTGTPRTTSLHSFFADPLNPGWDQLRLPLDAVAGHTDIRIQVNYFTNGNPAPGAVGLRMDDFIVGFAERGETVFSAPSGADFTSTFGVSPGEYQLEIRPGTEYASSGFPLVALNQSFDTNDRHNRSMTLLAPSGANISDGDTFILGDGIANQTFEFNSVGSIAFGNTPVAFSPSMTPAQVAGAIRFAINNQALINVEAESSGGLDTGITTDERLNLSGGSGEMSSSVRFSPGTSNVTVDLHDGVGDENVLRTQGQVIVEHNEISDARGIGVWSEPGVRERNPNHERLSSEFFFPIPHPLLIAPPVGNSTPGAVRNLPVLNDSVLGGLAPGIVIQNNTIDHAEFAGIKIDGQIAPLTIEVIDSDFNGIINGDDIEDGSIFWIDSGGTRVTFEFEDIGDGAIEPGGIPDGSTLDGGDGYDFGHVPIYYRHNDDDVPAPYRNRIAAYTHLEILHAIRESIQGSILMTNGLAELVEVTVGPSLTSQGPRGGGGFSFGGDLDFATPALYIEGASEIYIPGGTHLIEDQAAVYEAPQPFARIVNNTIYGDDGLASASPETALTSEPNDFLFDAVDTRMGHSHRDTYSQPSVLGDNVGPLGPDADVDFYRVYMEFGDRLTVDVDTVAGGPDTVLQIFDSSGISLAINDDDTGVDPLLDFTANETGIHYIGVSASGNDAYETRSLSGRVDGAPVGTGDYTINFQSFAPRSFVISVDGTTGGSFTITEVDGNTQTINVPGLRLPGGREADDADNVPTIMRTMANNINTSGLSLGIATALGGRSGDAAGLLHIYGYGFAPEDPALGDDFNTLGFGHAKDNGGDVAGTSTAGSTEIYLLIERVADVDISNATGLRLDPEPGRDTDQLINETGVMIAGGASPTLLNNVLMNLHESLVVEETFIGGFGVGSNSLLDGQRKPMEVIVVASVFQDPDGDEMLHQGIMSPPHGTTSSTSNVNGGIDDFNITLTGTQPSVQYAEANNFQPDLPSILIDSAVNSLVERRALDDVKTAIGVPINNILAPDLDVNGVVRADNPDFAPPGGLGSSVFRDRGSVELADFVGPIAIAEVPRDNDANGIDVDPAISFIELTEGIFQEFRIQLRDTGDASDPFTGIGIDDTTVVVPEIPDLREPGANVTVFENERLLREGIDYTFSYDETKNIVTLTPLAGIWRDDRAYRIELNNADREVLIAPDPVVIADGDQVSIIDDNGGTLVFEFESGYTLQVSEPITLVVPEVGTNAGGLMSGDIFVINDGTNTVTFEFTLVGENPTLPGTVPVNLPLVATPALEEDLPAFLLGIANEIASAIQGQVTAGNLDVGDPNGLVEIVVPDVGSPRVIIGAEAGAFVNTSRSGLQQLPRTLTLLVPSAGVGVGGIVDGDTFVVSNGSQSVTFEFDDDMALGNPGNTPVSIAGLVTAADVALAIRDTITAAGLGLTPSIEGNGLAVYLNLPLSGDAVVTTGQLSVVGFSRPPVDPDDPADPLDGDNPERIVITPVPFLADPSDPSSLVTPAPITLELNRIDERDINGNIINDGVTPGNIAINVDRSTTADELSDLIIGEISALVPISGLDQIEPISGGLLIFSGDEGFDNQVLGLDVTGTSLGVTGSIGVTGKSTIQVFGPLFLNLPLVGGGGILDGSVLVLTDDLGNDVIFEFNLNNTLPTVAGSIPVQYDTFSTVDVVADNLVAEINAANIGITAQNLGIGRVDLGRIDSNRVNIAGIPDPMNPIPGLVGVSVRRGIVSDGEILTISQGATSVSFEFESTLGGGGVSDPTFVPVIFQPSSTIGDIAVSLAAAINNNRGDLLISAEAELDSGGAPTGRVLLDDQPGTVVDVSQAATLSLTGIPGGATEVPFSPLFTSIQLKESLLQAINSVNQPGQVPVTTLSAEDRGGATLFVSGGQIFSGEADNYSLIGIADLAGNKLEENRDDLTTQFTILMPNIKLDYGDAPDPAPLQINGRYPTLDSSDGARHIVDGGLFLGNLFDVDLDGQPGLAADSDDEVIAVSSLGALFTVNVDAPVAGNTTIVVNTTVDPLTRDGDTITIDSGVAVATLEFDIDGRFEEDNFAIRPADPTSPDSIATAIRRAIFEASNPLQLHRPSVTVTGNTVVVSGDDEDGVIFTSFVNPNGFLSSGVATPIDVTVTGGGILEAWIDFNVDGDWDDPGEQIIPAANTNELCQSSFFTASTNNFFSGTGAVTRTFCVVAPTPPANLKPVETTYARFRVSREGDLRPGGLALSGEVEDYRLTLVKDLPPQVNLPTSGGAYQVEFPATEDSISPPQDLFAAAGLNPANTVVFGDDVGVQTLLADDGVTTAGSLDLRADGTFTFIPATDFFGFASVPVRVQNADNDLVNSRPISLTINVRPVNDPPVAQVADVSITRTIDEDTVEIFQTADTIGGMGMTIEGLIGDKYLPGPPNESSQPMIIQSAGSINGPFLSSRGGRIEIVNGGELVIYTPPENYSDQSTPDTFTYVVADVPGPGQLSQAAALTGRVTINFRPVNDPPIAADDSYDGDEGMLLTIPLIGDMTLPGILDNDRGGPPDEDQQVILLEFDTRTSEGGSVTLVDNDTKLQYDPPPLFSGIDSFKYVVIDSDGLRCDAVDPDGCGEVSINVGGVNNSPQFVGIGGIPGENSLTRLESKTPARQETFNLTSWFTDPEGDPITFSVTSSDPSIVSATLVNETLTLEFQPFAFTESENMLDVPVILSVTASDNSNASLTQQIPITVTDVPDPPTVVQPIGTLFGVEDQLIRRDLGAVFNDPDGDQLSYQVARLGTVRNPLPADFLAHPLVDSIGFFGDEMRITLKPDVPVTAIETVEIEIRATDGVFVATDTFTLSVSPDPDPPMAENDSYNVPVGSQLQIVNPANGLLGNDTDADGDSITVVNFTQPPLGTVTVNPNGTFTYTNESGKADEDTDTFSYQVIDSTGLTSGTATVTLTLKRSRYQNPIATRTADVNADGSISAIDALLIINLLDRVGTSSLPVSEIGAPPPPYYDVNGDGEVTALDILNVINELERRNNSTPQSELVASPVAAAVTTGFAAASTSGLAVRNVEPVMLDAESSRDMVLASGLEIDSGITQSAVDSAVAVDSPQQTSSESVDEALSNLLEDLDLDSAI